MGVTVMIMFSVGCATSRGELDIVVPELAESESGPLVFISEVTDRRVFELKPEYPSTPSLKDGDITNTAITSRAVARKRNGYGAALGDILLPEGRTVDQVVAAAVEEALEQKGYVVTDDAGATDIDLTVDISQFWGWVIPKFATVELKYASELTVTGDVVENGEANVSSTFSWHSAMPSAEVWLETFSNGLSETIADLLAVFKDPR